jgi:hypothetical protein
MKNPFRNERNEDEFLAALLRENPDLRVEVLPDGNKIVHGITLKPRSIDGITAADKLACAERELRLRRRNYHRYLATGRISMRKAAYELAVMRAIMEDYRIEVEKEQFI